MASATGQGHRPRDRGRDQAAHQKESGGLPLTNHPFLATTATTARGLAFEWHFSWSLNLSLLAQFVIFDRAVEEQRLLLTTSKRLIERNNCPLHTAFVDPQVA